jgi:hypothetical protein
MLESRSLELEARETSWTRADQIKGALSCVPNRMFQTRSIMLEPSWTGLDLIKSNVDSAERLTILTKLVHISSSVYPLSPFRCVTGSLVIGGPPASVCPPALYANAIPNIVRYVPVMSNVNWRISYYTLQHHFGCVVGEQIAFIALGIAKKTKCCKT